MAKRTDLNIGITGDMSGLISALGKARAEIGSLVQFASKQQVRIGFDTASLTEQFRKAIDKAMGDANARVRRTKPEPASVPAPDAPSSAPRSRPRKAPADDAPPPTGDGADGYAAAKAAAEKRFQDLRVKYQQEGTGRLIADERALINEKRTLQTINTAALDAETKKRIAIEKRALDEQLGMMRRISAENKDVINKGAGASVGQPGLFRKVAATGVLQFAAITQSVQVLSDTVNALSEPFRALNKEMGNIGALGVKNLDELQGAIVGFSKEMPDTADAIAAAIGEGIGSGVIAVDEKGKASIAGALDFAKTAGSLAIAGGAQIGQAVSGVAGVLNAYGMQATEANRVSDVLFNTYNLGVTSVADLASYLSQVTPVAAAAGVSLEQVSAAVATMTKQGQKTSDVTVKLRNFLVELQKPGAALKPILDKAGVSIDKIAKGEMTLQGAAQRINGTLASLGKSAPQVFSSIEAAGVVLGLSGKNAAVSLEDLEGIAARGTVAEGFAVQSRTADVMMRTMLNNVKAGFISFFSTVGSGLTATLSGAAQLAPTFATLASVKTILPEGFFGKIFPESMMASIKNGVAGMGKSVFGLIPGFTAAKAAGASTWAAIAGPILPIVAGIAAVVGMFVLLYNTSDSFKKTADGLFDGVVKGAVAFWDTVKPALTQMLSLAGEIGSAVVEFILVPFEIVGSVLGTVFSLIGSVVTSMTGASSSGSVLKDIFEKVRLAVIGIQMAVAGVRAAIDSIKGSVSDSFQALMKGDLGGAWDSFAGAGTKAGEAFGRAAGAKAKEEMRKILVEKGGEALDDQKEIDAEKKKAEKIVELRAKMQAAAAKKDFTASNAIAQEIASLDASLAVGTQKVTDAQGKVQEVIMLSGQRMDELAAATARAQAEGSGERQKAVIQGLIVQAQQLDENKKKLAEMEASRANMKAVDMDTSEIDKQIEDTKKTVADGASQMQQQMEQAKMSGMFDQIGPEAQGAFVTLKQIAGAELDAVDQKARDMKFGQLLNDAATIKGKIDSQDQLGKLVKEYESTTDKVKKAGIAKAIAEQVPQAVTAYDDMGNAVEVNVEKVQELAEKNKEVYSPDQLKNQQGFVAELRTQANEVAKNRDRMVELQEKIKASSDPKEVQRLTAEYEKVKGQVQEGSKKLGELVTKGKDLKLVSGDAKEMGEKFKMSARESREVSISTKAIGQAAKDAKADVTGMAEAFAKARSESQKAVNDARGAIAEMNRQIREEMAKGKDADKEKIAQLRRQKQEEIKAGQDKVAQDRALEKDNKDAGIALGLEKVEKRIAQEQDFASALLSIQDDTRRREAEIKNKGITDARARDRAEAERKTKEDADSAERNFLAQEEAIKQAAKEKKAITIKLKTVVDGKEVERVISGAENVRAELEKAKNLQVAKIREQGLVALEELERKHHEQALQEDVKASQERIKLQTDLINNEVETLTAADEITLTRRFAKRLELISLQQAQEIEAIVAGNAEYIRIYADMQMALAAVAIAKTPEEKVATEKRVAELRRELGLKQQEIITSDARILAIDTRFNAERTKLAIETEKDIEAARERAMVASITDSSERERATRRAENQKRLDEELAQLEEGERAIGELLEAGVIDEEEAARRMVAIREARARAFQAFRDAEIDADREYRKQTDSIYASSTSFIEGLHKSMFGAIDDERKRALEREIADLKKSQSELLQNLKDRRISYRDYLKDVAKLTKDQQDKEQELGRAQGDFWKIMAQGSLGGLRAIGDHFGQEMKAKLDDFGKSFEMAVQSGNFAATWESMGQIGIATMGQLTSKLADMAATGKATLGDFGQAVLLMSIQAAEGAVMAAIPAIFAWAMGSFLGPIGGAIAAAGSVALVMGLLAKAKGDVQSKLAEKGFQKGGYTGDGGPSQEAGVVHHREFVMPEHLTLQYREQFERIYRGESPFEVFAPEMSDVWFVDAMGQLQRRIDDVRSMVETRLSSIPDPTAAFASLPAISAQIGAGRSITDILRGPDLSHVEVDGRGNITVRRDQPTDAATDTGVMAGAKLVSKEVGKQVKAADSHNITELRAIRKTLKRLAPTSASRF